MGFYIGRFMASIYRVTFFVYIDGLVQVRRNSSALAMKLRLSCINPSIYSPFEYNSA